MIHLFEVENIKCGGCMNSIRKGLEAMPGVRSATPDAEKGAVAVEFDEQAVGETAIAHKLSEMGYPLAGHNSFGKKAKSFVSCAIGRMGIILLLVLAGTLGAAAQVPTGMVKKTAKPATTTATMRTETFMVLGNCGMCQKIIEKVSLDAGTQTASWNEETDLLTITFDTAKTSVDAVQKAIARAGYDNAGYKAADEAYKQLHHCCQYDRTGAAGGTKICEEPADH
jgi:copper chaperone CopZ